MEYLLILGLTIFGIFFNNKISYANRKFYLFIIFIVVVLVFGFRYKVGGDTLIYMRMYNKATPLDQFETINFLKERVEPGFQFLSSLFKAFTKEFWPLQMFLTALTNGLIFIFINKNCKNPFIGVFLYLFMQCLYFTTEILRESVAVGIFILNYKNIEEKKLGKYYLFSILSILFHYSAIFTLIIPFTKWLRLNLWFWFICAGCFLITPLVKELNQFISIASIANRVDTYTKDAGVLNLNLRLGVFIRSGLPCIAALFFIYKYKFTTKYYHLILLQILLCCAAFAIPDIFLRLVNYVSLFTTVVLANLLVLKTIKPFLRVMLVSFALLTQSNFLYINYSRWYPYVSIFDTTEYSVRDKLARYNFHQKWK